jgi:hypothetical protein
VVRGFGHLGARALAGHLSVQIPDLEEADDQISHFKLDPVREQKVHFGTLEGFPSHSKSRLPIAESGQHLLAIFPVQQGESPSVPLVVVLDLFQPYRLPNEVGAGHELHLNDVGLEGQFDGSLLSMTPGFAVSTNTHCGWDGITRRFLIPVVSRIVNGD